MQNEPKLKVGQEVNERDELGMIGKSGTGIDYVHGHMELAKLSSDLSDEEILDAFF